MNNDARRLRAGLTGLGSGYSRAIGDARHPDHYYIGQVHGLPGSTYAIAPVMVATHPVSLEDTAESVGPVVVDVDTAVSIPVALTRGGVQNGDILIARLIDGLLAAEIDAQDGPCGPCDLETANGTLDETHGTTQTYQGILLTFDAVGADRSSRECTGPQTITLPMRYRGFQRWHQFYDGNNFLTVTDMPAVWGNTDGPWRLLFNQAFSIYCQSGRYWLAWTATDRAANFTVGFYTSMSILWALQDDSCDPALFTVDPSVPVQCSAARVRVYHTNNTPIPSVQVFPIACDHLPSYYVPGKLAHSLADCELEIGGPATWTPIYHLENIGITGP